MGLWRSTFFFLDFMRFLFLHFTDQYYIVYIFFSKWAKFSFQFFFRQSIRESKACCWIGSLTMDPAVVYWLGRSFLPHLHLQSLSSCIRIASRDNKVLGRLLELGSPRTRTAAFVGTLTKEKLAISTDKMLKSIFVFFFFFIETLSLLIYLYSTLLQKIEIWNKFLIQMSLQERNKLFIRSKIEINKQNIEKILNLLLFLKQLK